MTLSQRLRILTIIRTDRHYNDDAARLLLIQIFDRLGNDDSRARTGRRQLATLLMVTVSDKPTNFIRTKIADQIKQGQLTEVVTRFPPEPNVCTLVAKVSASTLDWLKSGRCYLRFDDTNPRKNLRNILMQLKQMCVGLGLTGQHSAIQPTIFSNSLIGHCI